MTDRQSTHAADCWGWGPKHYECAEGEIKRLANEVEALRKALALLPDEHDMIEHNPDEGPRTFCCWQEVKLRGLHDYLITHDEDCWYARMRALCEPKEKSND